MIEQLREKISPEVRENEPMSQFTTFRIGGPAEYFFLAKSADDLIKAVDAAKELGLPCFVFGGGSNMVVSDEGVKGLVIRVAMRSIAIEGELVLVSAGMTLNETAVKATEEGLSGLEWAAGIPGSIGGAICGNSGSFGGEMKDVVENVLVLKEGEVVTFSNADCEFGYRDSIFRRTVGHVILSTTLSLKRAEDPEESRALMKSHMEKKREQQPIDQLSAGCIFMNWKPENEGSLDSMRHSLDLDKDEKIPLTESGTVPAAWILDRAQLKGFKVGHISVSEKHANFLVNDGEGSAENVVAMIAALKTRIRNMTDSVVHLTEEVEYVGF